MGEQPEQRQVALDSLRGWAILGMALSGLLPWGSLPAWMYHAQLPPPEMKHNPDVMGITWVDLVFPFFLFSMGAAMPLAMGRKLDGGQKPWETALGLLKRFGMLLLFAILVQNTRPASLPEPGSAQTQQVGLVLLAGMLCLYLSIKSLPFKVDPLVQILIRMVGTPVLIGAYFSLASEGHWNWLDQDIILRVLAAVSLTGGLTYWGSRTWKWLPYSVFGLVLAWFAACKWTPGVGGSFEWTIHPLLTRLEYQKYLLIVIPGMLYGSWLARPRDGEVPENDILASTVRLGAVVLCVVLLHRRDVWLCFWICTMVLMPFVSLRTRAGSTRNVHLAAWTILFAGLSFDLLGEGIRKDPATISYFLVTSSLAILFHQFLEWWHAAVRPEKPSWVAMVGANPLLGYVLITHFAFSFVRLTGIHGWIGNQGWSPWGLAAYGLAVTLLIGAIAALATRFRVFLRA